MNLIDIHKEGEREFEEKCVQSYAKGGFLTTDLVGDWALDKQPIKSHIHSVLEKVCEGEIARLKSELQTGMREPFMEGYNQSIHNSIVYWSTQLEELKKTK